MTTRALTNDGTQSHVVHVYSVEWTARERVFGVDGHEHHRESHGVVAPRRQRIVRSTLTSDYEVVEAVEDRSNVGDLVSPSCPRTPGSGTPDPSRPPE